MFPQRFFLARFFPTGYFSKIGNIVRVYTGIIRAVVSLSATLTQANALSASLRQVDAVYTNINDHNAAQATLNASNRTSGSIATQVI